MDSTLVLELVGLVLPFLHLVGALHAVHAIMCVRNSQSAIAWAISLITFPYLAIPLYWFFGRSKFAGYVESRRKGNLEINHIADKAISRIYDYRSADAAGIADLKTLEALARMPFTRANRVDLLVDGPATFDAIFEGIDRAQIYLLVQFFIIHDDELGRALKARLIQKARAGVRVLLLYDEVGSHDLPESYLQELRDEKIEVHGFGTPEKRKNRFQINFRNHRKIVVVDGRLAFVGGLNVGDEYMGRSARFGPWRDTHVRIEGPAVMGVQLAFLEDWYWASDQTPDLAWVPQPAADSNQHVLILPTGPADDRETCDLFFVHAINSARQRVWITSPYFVPDPPVIRALQLAALRGVDVRIMLPQKPDHLLVYLSAFSYLGEMERSNVRIFRYQPGFLHQKVMLVDDDGAVVGTANLDNRSFHLNFEIMVLVSDLAFAGAVARMLERDFQQCRQVTADEYKRRGFGFRLAVRIARLLSPVQ